MLAYAANAPRHAERRSSPNAMLTIVAVHVAVIAAVMSAKIELPPRFVPDITKIDFIKAADPPPAQPIEPQVPQAPNRSTFDQPWQEVSMSSTGHQIVDATPTPPNFENLIGSDLQAQPATDPTPIPEPLRIEARLLTPASELKPPYPPEKLLSEEEALLKLRLTIDERGRVVAVEPVGRADRVFLKAARPYLLAHWRYRPASEGGHAISSSIVITLRFTLDG